MATELRAEPLQFDLARLEQDPGAIHSYHREIQRRIASLLPPLEETLRIKDASGLHARLSERASALGIATLRPGSLLLLAQLFREEGLEMADHLFSPHAATLRAQEKQALLPVGAQVQKTVSLLIGGRLVLVTSVGDQVLTREIQIAIATRVGFSRKAGRHATINPPGLPVERELGLLRGMISPFLPAGCAACLHAIVQLPWPRLLSDDRQSVAVSLSPCESLLIPLRCYRRILQGYVCRSRSGTHLVEMEADELSTSVCHPTKPRQRGGMERAGCCLEKGGQGTRKE